MAHLLWLGYLGGCAFSLTSSHGRQRAPRSALCLYSVINTVANEDEGGKGRQYVKRKYLREMIMKEEKNQANYAMRNVKQYAKEKYEEEESEEEKGRREEELMTASVTLQAVEYIKGILAKSKGTSPAVSLLRQHP